MKHIILPSLCIIPLTGNKSTQNAKNIAKIACQKSKNSLCAEEKPKASGLGAERMFGGAIRDPIPS